MKGRLRRGFLGVALFVSFVMSSGLVGCSLESTKGRYLLAERLWQEGKHAAAVVEFDRVTRRDPKGRLGLQALYRSGMTEALFLKRPQEALGKLRQFVSAAGNTDLAWEAQQTIGDLLFSTLEQYEQAISHYRRQIELRPQDSSVPESLNRIAKSHFFLWRFDDALETFGEIERKYQGSPAAEGAAYEIARIHFTQGRERTERSGALKHPCLVAIESFERYLRLFPRGARVADSRFGIAQCQEEMDLLEQAAASYSQLLDSYPDRQIIELKLARIRDRRLQRNR